MGGDGGTLNNTRREHVRLRRASGLAPGGGNDTRSTKDFSSVTLCAVSRQPLEAPVVVDRLGQLYNREALVGSLLARGSSREGPLAHIRSLSRDTAVVRTAIGECAATKDKIVDAGRFGVGWKCGCVVSCTAVEEMRSNSQQKGPGKKRKLPRDNNVVDEVDCIACGKPTHVVRVGLAWDQRETLRTTILLEMATRAQKKSLKRKKASKKEALLGHDTIENINGQGIDTSQETRTLEDHTQAT